MIRRGALAVAVALGVAPVHSDAATSGCERYHGRDYIICRESGPENMPGGLPAGAPHPGPSTASGPCGMLAGSRRDYGGDSMAACARYMADRYGSWAAAERFHRARGWW